jgi:hypothetical protein
MESAGIKGTGLNLAARSDKVLPCPIYPVRFYLASYYYGQMESAGIKGTELNLVPTASERSLLP